MTTEPSATLKSKAQEVLEELYRRNLIPFKLTAFNVEWVGLDKYTVYFHDTRLHSVTISWVESESFRDAFRSAVLDSVSKMS